MHRCPRLPQQRMAPWPRKARRAAQGEAARRPLTLVLARDAVFGHVGVDHGARLEEELPQERLADLLVQAAHVDGGIWGARRRSGGGASPPSSDPRPCGPFRRMAAGAQPAPPPGVSRGLPEERPPRPAPSPAPLPWFRSEMGPAAILIRALPGFPSHFRS